MVKIPEKVREDLVKMQQIQQQVQILMFQKQNVQIQLSEVENAMKEIKQTKEGEVYEIVGTVMLKKKKDELRSRLEDKKEILNLRISTIDKQLEKLNAEVKKIQEKISKHIKSGG